MREIRLPLLESNHLSPHLLDFSPRHPPGYSHHIPHHNSPSLPSISRGVISKFSFIPQVIPSSVGVHYHQVREKEEGTKRDRGVLSLLAVSLVFFVCLFRFRDSSVFINKRS
eukprot:GILI01036950.1.p1 GENE.GILI01036950.1~~GILI01036950.1.p1  ORF type:complete len:112 (-),score=4.23 GILI01036950.1:15-350(-)